MVCNCDAQDLKLVSLLSLYTGDLRLVEFGDKYSIHVWISEINVFSLCSNKEDKLNIFLGKSIC